MIERPDKPLEDTCSNCGAGNSWRYMGCYQTHSSPLASDTEITVQHGWECMECRRTTFETEIYSWKRNENATASECDDSCDDTCDETENYCTYCGGDGDDPDLNGKCPECGGAGVKVSAL